MITWTKGSVEITDLRKLKEYLSKTNKKVIDKILLSLPKEIKKIENLNEDCLLISEYDYVYAWLKCNMYKSRTPHSSKELCAIVNSNKGFRISNITVILDTKVTLNEMSVLMKQTGYDSYYEKKKEKNITNNFYAILLPKDDGYEICEDLEKNMMIKEYYYIKEDKPIQCNSKKLSELSIKANYYYDKVRKQKVFGDELFILNICVKVDVEGLEEYKNKRIKIKKC